MADEKNQGAEDTEAEVTPDLEDDGVLPEHSKDLPPAANKAIRMAKRAQAELAAAKAQLDDLGLKARDYDTLGQMMQRTPGLFDVVMGRKSMDDLIAEHSKGKTPAQAEEIAADLLSDKSGVTRAVQKILDRIEEAGGKGAGLPALQQAVTQLTQEKVQQGARDRLKSDLEARGLAPEGKHLTRCMALLHTELAPYGGRHTKAQLEAAMDEVVSSMNIPKKSKPPEPGPTSGRRAPQATTRKAGVPIDQDRDALAARLLQDFGLG